MNISISQKWCGWGWDIHKGEISCFLIHYGLVSNCIVLCIQDVNLDTSVKTAGKYACMQYGMLKLATPITDHCPFSSHKTGPPESPCNIEKVRISTEMCDKGWNIRVWPILSLIVNVIYYLPLWVWSRIPQLSWIPGMMNKTVKINLYMLYIAYCSS